MKKPNKISPVASIHLITLSELHYIYIIKNSHVFDLQRALSHAEKTVVLGACTGPTFSMQTTTQCPGTPHTVLLRRLPAHDCG